MSSSYKITKKRYDNPSVNIESKIVIITGANTGIGKATALEIAKRKAKVYFACRDEERGKSAIEEVKNATKNDNLHYLKLDLGSLESIRECAEKFHQLEKRLDVLINNAGVLAPASRTSDGFEMNIGVNHLGHFLFTNLLLDLLKASAPSRIVIVSSQAYMGGSINRDNLNSEKSFSNVAILYGNSKLANLLFMHELNKKLEGTGVTVNSLCPGTVQTEAARYLNPVMKFFMIPMMKLFYSTPEIGSQTSLFLAVEPSLVNESGNFYIGCKKKELMAKAKDDETAKWLWDTSVELTKLN